MSLVQDVGKASGGGDAGGEMGGEGDGEAGGAGKCGSGTKGGDKGGFAGEMVGWRASNSDSRHREGRPDLDWMHTHTKDTFMHVRGMHARTQRETVTN